MNHVVESPRYQLDYRSSHSYCEHSGCSFLSGLCIEFMSITSKPIHYTKAFLCSQPNVTSFLLRVYPKELGCWPDLINQVSSGNGLQPVNIDADEEKRDKEGQKSRDGMLLMQMIRDL